jgi:hypothetical protein
MSVIMLRCWRTCAHPVKAVPGGAGADRVLAMDLHSGQCVGYFDIPVDHVYGDSVILDYLASKRISTGDLVRHHARSLNGCSTAPWMPSAMFTQLEMPVLALAFSDSGGLSCSRALAHISGCLF